MRRSLVVLPVVALLLASCGGDESADVPDVAGATLPDAPPAPDGAGAQGIAALSAALDEITATRPFRADLALGMEMRIDELGQSLVVTPDLATPMMTLESDADGEQYALMDLGPMMRSIAESSGLPPDAFDQLGDLTMEMWIDGSTITVDLAGFGPILEQSGGVPGLSADRFTVDVTRLGASVSSADIASALGGQAVVDPVETAELLQDALAGSATSDDGTTFRGTITLAEFSAAMGQDPDQFLGSAGGLGGGFEGEEAAQLMLDLFADILVDVEVTLADGAVDVVRYDMDMSPIFAAMPALLEASGEPIPADQLDEAADVFAGATFEMTMLMDYDLDDSVAVEIPAGDHPDLTDEFVEIFGASFGD